MTIEVGVSVRLAMGVFARGATDVVTAAIGDANPGRTDPIAGVGLGESVGVHLGAQTCARMAIAANTAPDRMIHTIQPLRGDALHGGLSFKRGAGAHASGVDGVRTTSRLPGETAAGLAGGDGD